MKNRKLQALLGSGLVALAWAANAQSQSSDSSNPNGARLRKAPDAAVTPEEPSSQGRGHLASFDAAKWKESLSEGNLDQRQGSYEELVQIARRDPAARAALEEWSRANDELAWTSRLALRELGRGSLGNRSWRQPDLSGRDGLESWFEMPFGGQGMNHRQLFEDLERRLDELFGSQSGMNQVAPGTGPSGSEMSSHGQSFQLESTPDGVKVHVEEDHDGNTETRDYEAKDMQELLQRYPELREHIGTEQAPPSGELREELGTLRDRLRSMRQLGSGEHERGNGDGQAQEMPTDVLGVYISGPAEAGAGLLVERIEPGTIAKAIGIQRGDSLLEINGTPLADAADVSRVLKDRHPDQELNVKVRDRRGEERTLTWKPSSMREL